MVQRIQREILNLYNLWPNLLYAPQQGVYAREKNTEIERFGQVIVGRRNSVHR